MNEQEAADTLEQLVGGASNCFRLVRLYTSCQQAASGNAFTLSKQPTTEERFRSRAKEEGFSTAAVEHYLNYCR